MREALKLALEALKQIDAAMPFPVAKLAIKKAEEALMSVPDGAQPEQIQPDKVCIEDDGCPTEKAVLQRFWREHQKTQPEQIPPSAYSNTHQPEHEQSGFFSREAMKAHSDFHVAQPALASEQKRPQNCGTGYCSCIECVMEPDQEFTEHPPHRHCECIDCVEYFKPEHSAPYGEPVAWLHRQGNFTEACMNPLHDDEIDRGWMQEPLYTTPPQRKPLTDEHYRAIREAHYIVASDAYFGARSHTLDTNHNRTLFEAAFNRGFEAAHGIKE